MDKPFEIVGRTQLLDAECMDVQEVEVRPTAGGDHFTRRYVRHPGAVGIVAINDVREVFLVWQYRAPVDGSLFEIPAGKRDIDGEDPLVCAQRELREEAGLLARSWMELMTLHLSPGYSDERAIVYLARDLEMIERQAHGAEEVQMSVVKMSLEQAIAKIFSGEITVAMSIAGIFGAAKYLES